MYKIITWNPSTHEEVQYPPATLFYNEDVAVSFGCYIIENIGDYLIVMIVELDARTCKNCRRLICEKPGWILHKWIHVNSGAHLCHPEPGQMLFAQAEPIHGV